MGGAGTVNGGLKPRELVDIEAMTNYMEQVKVSDSEDERG